MTRNESTEHQRLHLQDQLDAQKTQTERNRLGQFATPSALAHDLLAYANTLLPKDVPIHFLDPAIGTGAFYSALRNEFPARRIRVARGFEVDPHYAVPARQLWASSKLDIRIEDFTQLNSDEHRYNLLICNPPYVRHHHISNDVKASIQLRTGRACGIKIGGLAGLYCYFLGLSHAWLAPGAISGWLVPSEFMDVNYGRAVKRYLLERVTLLHVHRFDPNDVQFADALVSSAVVWFRNEVPPKHHAVKFTLGGTLSNPHYSRVVSATALSQEPKWTRFPAAGVRCKSAVPVISDFFKIKRGVATGDNSYFILSEAEIARRHLPRELLRPILPSPRYLIGAQIDTNPDGTPRLEQRLFLLNTQLSETDISKRYPELWHYLQEGRTLGLHERYLCRHRAPWYAQENRPPSPIVCTYLGRRDTKRSRPFTFILNGSQATVANVYLAMYPTPLLEAACQTDPQLIRAVWELLNRIAPDRLLAEGRVYGGGLHKLEPKELANVPVPELASLLPRNVRPPQTAGTFCGRCRITRSPLPH